MVFQWANLSKGLLREFARSVGLRVSLASDNLSTKFGEPPADDMVEQLWPTLRDRWLATRPVARDRVVKELRTAGLGDKSIKVSTKTGQMAYLRSCRQSNRLRAAVLAAFLDEGSQRMVAASVIADSTSASRPPEPAANDTLDDLRQALEGMDLKREVTLELMLKHIIVDFARKYSRQDPDDVRQGASRLAASLAVALTASTNSGVGPAAPNSPYREKVVRGAHRLAIQDGPGFLLTSFSEFGAEMLADPENGTAEIAIIAVTTALAMIAAAGRPPDDALYAEVARGTEWLWTSPKREQTVADAIRDKVATKRPPRSTPPIQAKDPWSKPYIFDYWDSRTGAIAVFSGALREPIGNEQRERIARSISAAVEDGVNKLSDKDLLLMAVTMVDDVYKAADCTELWDTALEKYLRASAGAFAQALAKRGYQIHYLVDNTFENTESGMQRPLELYPMWFNAAGFVYMCPQHVALMLMQKDGISRSEYLNALSKYIAEARAVSDGLVEQCHLAKKHLVYLDTDSVAGGFDRAAALQDSPGIITIYRDSAPASGSKVTVTLPNERAPS